MKRKNIIAVTLCAAVVLSLGACQNKGKEAEEKAGFEITVPDQLRLTTLGSAPNVRTHGIDIQSTE